MMDGVAGINRDKYSRMCGDVNNAIATFMPVDGTTRVRMVLPGDKGKQAAAVIAEAVGNMAMGDMGASPMGGIGSLAEAGVNGDSMVAHMSPEMFGSLGSDNPMNEATGLRQAFSSGDDDAGGGQGSGTTDTSGDPSMDDPLAGDDPHGYGQETSNTGRENSGWGGPTDVTDVVGYSKDEHGKYSVNYDRVPDLATRSLAYDLGISTRDLSKMAAVRDITQSTMIDRILEARTTQKPTDEQLDMNRSLEKGFQTANPNMTAAVKGIGSIASLVSPAPFGTMFGIAKSLTDPKEEGKVSFMDRVSKGIAGLFGSEDRGAKSYGDNPEANTSDGGDGLSEVEGDPTADLDGSEGLTDGELEVILENYGSVEAFEDAFILAFGRKIEPSDYETLQTRRLMNQAPTPEPALAD